MGVVHSVRGELRVTTRRSFIRGALAAAALAVSPVALNVARLRLADSPAFPALMRVWERGRIIYDREAGIGDPRDHAVDAGRYSYRVTKGVL